MKKKYIILVIALLLKSVVAVSQNSVNEKLVVSNFVKAIFFEKNTPKAIAEKYILFRPKDNPEASIDDRVKILGKHLKKIKKEKIPLLDPTNYTVVSYDDYKDVKINFRKNTDVMYILISKGQPVMYFYMEGERILSFDYFLKTGDGYFILY
jgi:hypothetical protein